MRLSLIKPDSPFVDALVNAATSPPMLTMPDHQAHNGAQALCKDRDKLAELVDLCFWASLAAEEGRPVRGMICICSPGDAPMSRAIAKPVVASSETLVSLLTASPLTPLGVHLSGNNLEIWGFLDSLPASPLQLRIPAVGTVTASSDERVIAIVNNGSIMIPAESGVLDPTRLVAEVLSKANPFPIRLMRATLLMKIVAVMHQHGHGGTLVLAPTSTNAWRADIRFQHKFSDTGARFLRDQVQAYENAREKGRSIRQRSMVGQIDSGALPLLSLHLLAPEAHLKLLELVLRNIGHLTAIDGGLIIDEDLQVIGFGAKLQAEANDFGVVPVDVVRRVADKMTIPLSDLGGTRHQSAARFVNRHHDTAVFVASQDGRLTLFAWAEKDQKVIACRRLEHLV